MLRINYLSSGWAEVRCMEPGLHPVQHGLWCSPIPEDQQSTAENNGHNLARYFFSPHIPRPSCRADFEGTCLSISNPLSAPLAYNLFSRNASQEI